MPCVVGSKWDAAHSALFLLIQEMTEGKVPKQIVGFGGVVLQTSLDKTKEQVLRDALQRYSAEAGSGSPA